MVLPLPRLPGARLEIGFQTAEEVFPPLGDWFGRRILPTAVVEGHHHGAAGLLDTPIQGRADPGRHVVRDTGPAHRFVRLYLVDAKAHVHGAAILDETQLGLAP